MFTRGSPKGQVNYEPYESTEKRTCLSEDLHKELIRQHKLYKLTPSGRDGDGLIAEYTRYIPYSSEKKGFFGKTGKGGFNGERIEMFC